MARKPNFIKRKKRKVHGATFWDNEYTNPSHLKLSTIESGDLAKFTRWIERQGNETVLPKHASAFDASTPAAQGARRQALAEHWLASL